MGATRTRHGPWDPVDAAALGGLFDGLDEPWWLIGGVALDRFLGRPTRPHDDIDVEVPRHALAAVLRHLDGWDPHTAHDGVLTPLVVVADQPAAANGVWFRESTASPWRFDLKLALVEGDVWRYRRDPSIERPLASVRWFDDTGIPVVAPEVQLLFKARAERPKDTADAQAVVPELDAPARRWLVDAVRQAHPTSPWLDWL